MNALSKKTVHCGMTIAAVLLFVLLIWIDSRTPFVSNSDVDGISEETTTTCAHFGERLLWSSGYSNNREGSVTYQTWYPKHDCATLRRQDCVLDHIEVQARFLHLGDDDDRAEGYIQLSDLDASICEHPMQGTYSRYVVHERDDDSSQTTKWYCEGTRSIDGTCSDDLIQPPIPLSPCYGVKAYATQHSIIDAFNVNYTICWNEHG